MRSDEGRTMKQANAIPILDLADFAGTAGDSDVALDRLSISSSPQTADQFFNKAASELYDAFKSVGFVYLKNHGIPGQIVTDAFARSKDFFSLPKDDKGKVVRDADVVLQGFTGAGREILDKAGPAGRKEIRESLDMVHFDQEFPADVPELKEAMTSLRMELHKLALLLLRLLAAGMRIPVSKFIQWHNGMGTSASGTALRTLYYPALKFGDDQGELEATDSSNEPSAVVDKPEEVIRCGEHSDYGTITLLLQDDIGGLEVQLRDGNWVSADPVPETVLVNIGDLVEIWTNGDLIATKHRVVIPPASKLAKARQSIVLFVHPNDDVLVEPLPAYVGDRQRNETEKVVDDDGQEGENQGVIKNRGYKRVISGEYLRERLRATYV